MKFRTRINDCTGYGLVGQEVLDALKLLSPVFEESILEDVSCSPNILHCPATSIARNINSGTVAVYTAWESTIWPPDAVKAILNSKCSVFVVSNWCKKTLEDTAFSMFGAPIRVKVARHGIAPVRSNRSKRSIFTAYTASTVDGGGVRRDLETVFAAFKQAFGNRTGVKLVARIPNGASRFRSWESSNIELRSGWATRQELLDEISESSVFVSGSRSEGWGRMHQEASELRTVPITILYSGISEFLDPCSCYHVPHVESPAGSFYRGDWSTFQVDDVSSCLVRAFENRGELAMKAEAARQASLRHRPSEAARLLYSVL